MTWMNKEALPPGYYKDDIGQPRPIAAAAEAARLGLVSAESGKRNALASDIDTRSAFARQIRARYLARARDNSGRGRG